ncbi:hypothetical protein B0A48_16124 [Cryoendolithus antarcticus]|uniref:Uncharacterized protein n=1 Tax=Cryoendolithus antarcticus TaxID=1507870 RepID=A0A1V8SF83_9PEZI|nr:hypothetical protein B0A48_16124 [Cryoendolithus antarcticus]
MEDLPPLPDPEAVYKLYDDDDLDEFCKQAGELLDKAHDLSRFDQVHLLIRLANCADTTTEMIDYLQRAERIWGLIDLFGDKHDPAVVTELRTSRDAILHLGRIMHARIMREEDELWGDLDEPDESGHGGNESPQSSGGEANDGRADADASSADDVSGAERDDGTVTSRAVDGSELALPEIANAAPADAVEKVTMDTAESGMVTSDEAKESVTGLSTPGLSSLSVRKKASGMKKASESGESQMSPSQRRRQMLVELERKLEENEAERVALLREKRLIE